MERIDILAYKWDVDNTDSFNEDIIAYSPNSIILNWNYNKIWVQYKPENIKLNKTTINFLKFKNQRSFLTSIAQMLQVFKLFLVLCYKFRPKIFIVENYLEGVIAGIMRKFKLADKTIYLPADWYAGFRYKKVISNIVNNVIFPYLDYLACRLNDVVIDRLGGGITESRNKYWGRKIPTTKEQYAPQPRIQATNVYAGRKRVNICFIGEMRQDSGLDIAIESLTKIREHLDINIKVIGPKRLHYEYFMKLAERHNLIQCVEFLGFVEREDFDRVLSDCFCGINILTTAESYSTRGMPSKLMYYFQYLLPVIISEGVPQFVKLNIIDNELGVIITPSTDEFVNAVLNIYSKQEFFRMNIKKYIESFPKRGIIEFLKN